ncbi:MAG: hypothetical protein ABIK48_04095 [candidate division WOR-3 bacterium]
MSNLRKILILAPLIIVLPALGKEQFSSSFYLGADYDRNLFCLSPSELTSFLQRQDTMRFPYRSADDLDFTTVGELAVRFSPKTSLSLRLRGHNYLVNREKSYGVIGVEFEQQLGRFRRVLLYYRWLPSYLLRYYRPVNSSRYYPCRFSEQLAGISFEQRLAKISITPSYRFEHYDYIPPFQYYNTSAHCFELKLNWRESTSLRFLSGYNFKLARAAAEIPDISHLEHSLFLALAIHPRLHLLQIGFRPEYEYKYRLYTAEPVDSAHYGRVDQLHIINLRFDYRFNLGTVYFWFGPEWRDVDAPYHNKIEEIKEYRTFHAGLGITVRLKSVSPSHPKQEGEE